jgi:hypothetical protein
MSGESLVHVRLIEYLVVHVRRMHYPPRGLLLLADHHAFGTNRPPSISGFTPDLFASDLPATFEVLGEAKTPLDLETERSVRQISAFLDHLAVRPESSFYLSVPAFSKARAQAFLNRLIRDQHRTIRIEVVDGV